MLRPLTKKRTDGRPYKRRPKIETLLMTLVELDRDTILERLTAREGAAGRKAMR